MSRSVSPPRSELRVQLRLALPIMGGQLAQTGNGVVDTVMSGQVSPEDLAAVAMGASVWVPLYLFMTGALMSASPLISRQLGAAAYHRVLPIAQQSLLLALCLGVLGVLLLNNLMPVMVWLEVDPALRPIVRGYLQGLSVGLPGAALFLSMRAYTEGMGHTRPVFWISVAGLLVNIPVNYILIHGLFGLPKMGGAGCGWATGIVFWCMAGLLALYIRRHDAYRQARLTWRGTEPDLALLGRMLRLGTPIGLAIFFESSIFAVIALLIGHLGAVVVAGHQVALNFTSLIFILPLSLGIALTVRVARARGAGSPAALRATLQTGRRLAIGGGLATALLILLVRPWVPMLYTNNPAVQQLASALLLYAAFYQVSDAIQIMASGVLRGFEDTAMPMLLTLFAYWGIGLPCGYLLARTDLLGPPMGPAGFWIGLIIGLTVAAFLLWRRLRHMLRHHLHRLLRAPRTG